MTIKTDTKELERLMKKHMNTNSLSIRVQTNPSSGTRRLGRTDKYITEHRTAGKNAVIFNTQKKRRNPVFIDNTEKSFAGETINKGINSFIFGDTSAIERCAEKLGQFLVDNIKKHIINGKSESGKMKAVKKYYQNIKEASTGIKNIPVLIFTGQLIGSLYYIVKRKRL